MSTPGTALDATLDAAPLAAPYVELLPAVMTLGALCAALGMSKSTVYRAIKRGDLPKARRIGGSARWLGANVARALENAS